MMNEKALEFISRGGHLKATQFQSRLNLISGEKLELTVPMRRIIIKSVGYQRMTTGAKVESQHGGVSGAV